MIGCSRADVFEDVMLAMQEKAEDRRRVLTLYLAVEGVDDKGTGLMATRFGGQQESDMLEKSPGKFSGKGALLGDKYKDAAPLADAETAHVQLVSLGSYCGPKLSFQKMGRGAETLPFDWIRTRMSGILRLLRILPGSNFEGFYDFVTQMRVPDTGLSRCQQRHERYNRRIARLWDIDSEVRPVLFVRSIVSNEVGETLDLACDKKKGPALGVGGWVWMTV
ncbi:hypothetical protein AK812_SmicGene8533 [Symbiodinium microadriaticum]|uniref:Uncharacterized protein n=1 Tax=Symbiodinium microadriaticum TaxID=2951 RepID=A0A1Q9EKQ8_SYMMI|nr:hypothetical protein AK812_SmicGene8533 [Symbiodinium microadriaticum]